MSQNFTQIEEGPQILLYHVFRFLVSKIHVLHTSLLYLLKTQCFGYSTAFIGYTGICFTLFVLAQVMVFSHPPTHLSIQFSIYVDSSYYTTAS